MASCLKDYKKYPFPVRFLITYAVITVVAIVGLDLFASWRISMGIRNMIGPVIGLFTIFFFGGGLLSASQLYLITGKKIYRGIGIYRLLIVVCIVSVLFFAGMIAFLRWRDIPYTPFQFFTLLCECLLPIYTMVFFRIATQRCNRCGLIMTMNGGTCQTETLGKKVKYHTEGGYYKNVTTTTQLREQNSVAPSVYDATFTTRQYVPKTTVRDGEYERQRKTCYGKCCVCGNTVSYTYEREVRIGD